MKFTLTHRFMKHLPVEEFTEDTAPDWLTSVNSVPGSTMDSSWFWRDYVLTLPINGKVKTDFTIITRVE